MAWVLRCSGSHKTIVKEVSPEIGDPFSSSRGGFPPAVELMQACIFKASKREYGCRSSLSFGSPSSGKT